MTHLTALAALLFSTMLVSTGRSQDQSADLGCDIVAPEGNPEPSPRMHATRVKDAEGKSHWVFSPVKELKVARLIFIGQPALPLPVQDQIAKSLTVQDRNDDEDAQEELVERIRDAWQQQGYFKAEVKLSGIQVLSEGADSKTVAVTVNIVAGKQYRLDEIRFKTDISNSGNRSAPPGLAEVRGQFSANELREFFPIKQGDVLDTHEIQAGIVELRKAYGARGFINMSVVPTFELDERDNRVTINLEIEEGRQFRIGSVGVVGYDPPAVHALIRNFGIVPGVIFNGAQMNELTRQMHAMLPDQFDPEAVERRLDEGRGTVSLIFNIYVCPRAP